MTPQSGTAHTNPASVDKEVSNVVYVAGNESDLNPLISSLLTGVIGFLSANSPPGCENIR